MTTPPNFQIGQWVRSVPVGNAPAFNCEIIEIVKDCFIVRDASKKRFARTANEMEPLQ